MTSTEMKPVPVAADPVRAEALDESSAVILFEGATYTVPRDLEEWPAETMLAMEEGKAITAIRMLLPADQWKAFMAPKPPMKKVAGLLDAIAIECGFKSAGE